MRQGYIGIATGPKPNIWPTASLIDRSGENRGRRPAYYIHGTPEERNIGTPASYGCVRMRSHDVIDLYNVVGRGAKVYIVNLPLRGVVPGQ